MSELPPDQQALLKQAREANLLKAWAGGRRKLSASELAEIAHLIPSTSPPTDPPPEPSGRRKRAKYAKKLSEYEAIYETSYRNLRRWIATGIQKGKPVPLDDPGAMAGWWIDCMKHIVPAKIAALAAQPALAAGPHVGNDVTGPLPPVDPSKQLPALDIDLSVLGKDPGKIVQQAQALVDAAYMKLEQGYRIPDDAMLRHWYPRWEKAAEALRKQVKDEIASRKTLGLVIDRAAVEADISQALALLKRMRERMAQMVCDFLRRELPDLDPLILAKTAQAVEVARSREDETFRDLLSLKAPSDVEFELAP